MFDGYPLMGCAAGCGGKRRKVQEASGTYFNPTSTKLSTNDRGMVLLNDDDYDCDHYDGAFNGTTVFIVGHGTEHERVYLANATNRAEAWRYAVENQLTWHHVSVVSMCHDTIVAMTGA